MQAEAPAETPGPRMRDRTGERHGLLVVLGFAGRHRGRGYWEALCDCGRYTVVAVTALYPGGIRSCGCLRGRPPKARAPAVAA